MGCLVLFGLDTINFLDRVLEVVIRFDAWVLNYYFAVHHFPLNLIIAVYLLLVLGGFANLSLFKSYHYYQ